LKISKHKKIAKPNPIESYLDSMKQNKNRIIMTYNILGRAVLELYGFSDFNNIYMVLVFM
jgi:hypothetical protein